MYRNLFLIISISIAVTCSAQSQRAIELHDKAESLLKAYLKSYNGNKDLILEALGAINKAIKISPGYVEAYLLKGDIYTGMDSCKQATRFIETAIALDSTYYRSYLMRCSLEAYCFEDIQSALKDINMVITLNPKFAGAYNMRGNFIEILIAGHIIIESDSTYNLVLKDYTKSIELEPNTGEFYLYRASFKYNTLKDVKGACEDWRKAKELGEDVEYELYNYCGWDGR